jgi:hypothetical protein
LRPPRAFWVVGFVMGCRGPLRLTVRPSGVTGIERRGMEARSGEAPVWRCHNSDDWFRWTASMASAQAIQASCQATAVQKDYVF